MRLSAPFLVLCSLLAAAPAGTAQARLDLIPEAGLGLDAPAPLSLHPLPDSLDAGPSPLRTAGVIGFGVGAAGYELVRRQVIDPRAHDAFTVEYDWSYARWADKPGHAFSTALQTRIWAAGYRWAGHDDQTAALLGGATAFAGMLYYEVLDGFDLGVGFSPPDLGANAVGAGLVVAQALVPPLEAVDLKLSYWPSDGNTCDASCDYEGQTAWLTVNPHRLAPVSARDVLPPWLNLAVGYGARDGDVRFGFDESVVYLGLDLELAGLPIRGKVWEALVPWLRMIHLPAPALRLSPDVGVELLAY
ncbi:MAG: DUF2279 domain-containing protein [Rhodothermaceae bacterium]|nr:DUF2279 domain-containing protein [Rhodothermaceae bacterium]